MEFVINRILFSLFCMENGIAAFFDNHVYKRFIIFLCRILYKYDPFRNIRRNYVSFDEYVKHTFESAKEAAENEDYGLSIDNSSGTLCIVLFPFILWIIFLLNSFLVSFGINLTPMILVMVSLIISYLVCYLFSFKEDKYKMYFAKFRKSGCNNKWHIITVCVCCSAILSFYLLFFVSNLVRNF